jgi:uncharacterized protein with PQ loop repeat
MINIIIEVLFTIFLMSFILSKIPQIVLLYKRKTSGDISTLQYWALAISCVFTICYGFYKNSPSIVIANISNLIVSCIILYQCYYYKSK